MKKNKKDENCGHVWVMWGDVSRCEHCHTYLGLWDGKKECEKKPLTNKP